MIIITNTVEMTRVLCRVTDATLRRILTERAEQLAEYDGYDLGELAHFLIVEPSDSLDTIEAALGFSPLTNLVEVVVDHGGWFEAVFILGDDGFGWVLLIPDQPDIDPAFLHLCSETPETR